MVGGLLLTMLAVTPSTVSGQQVSDDEFRFRNPDPSFESGRGPSVCIDEGHFNFHTADGRYRSFADLLRGDGYVVRSYGEAFHADGLDSCDLLVVANPLAAANSEDWSYPHPSAFAAEEMEALIEWVRGRRSVPVVRGPCSDRGGCTRPGGGIRSRDDGCVRGWGARS